MLRVNYPSAVIVALYTDLLRNYFPLTQAFKTVHQFFLPQKQLFEHSAHSKDCFILSFHTQVKSITSSKVRCLEKRSNLRGNYSFVSVDLLSAVIELLSCFPEIRENIPVHLNPCPICRQNRRKGRTSQTFCIIYW